MRSFVMACTFAAGLTAVFSQSVESMYDHVPEIDRIGLIVQKQKIDSLITLEKIVLDGFDSKIPFYHYSNGINNNAPYVILLHGLGDSKEDWVNPSEPYLDWGRNISVMKDSLLSLGYNIIIPDVKYHGERSYEIGFRPAASLPPAISQNENDAQLFKTMISSTIKDLRIIMDYVQERHDRTDQYFGVIGYSLGGNLAILLSMFDDRVSRVVGCVAPVNLPARGLEELNWPRETVQGQMNITPMTHTSRQKAPVLLLMGKKDFYTTAGEVSRFISEVPAKDKKVKYFDAGHILPNEYRVDAIDWINSFN